MTEYWVIGEHKGGLFRIRATGNCEWEVLLPGKKRIKGKAGSYRIAKNMVEGIIEGLSS